MKNQYILSERAAGTYRSYNEMMNLYLLKVFGKRKLDEITPQRLKRWHKWMGKHGKKTAADVALRTLSSFFRWAIEENKAVTNPARDIPRHNSHKIHRPMDMADRRKAGQTIQEMLLRGKANPIYLKAILLAMATGLRRRSIVEMKWKDVNFEQKFVKVRDKSFRVHGEKIHALGGVAISILKSIPRIQDSPWVFPGRDPEDHMSPNTLNRYWDMVRTQAGLAAPEEVDRYGNTILAPNIRLHDLRHTKGAVLGAKHENTMVAATMGLSSAEMANRYGKPVPSDVAEANWEAENILGADLGIIPDLDDGYQPSFTPSAPAAMPIVIQISWPFRPQTPAKPPKPVTSPKHVASKVDWPSTRELQRLVLAKPVTEVARDLGVSDKAVEKRCKKLGLKKRPRGYWAKVKAGID